MTSWIISASPEVLSATVENEDRDIPPQNIGQHCEL